MDSLPAVQTNARILIVDDQESCARFLEKLLERAGYAICITITDPAVAVQRMADIAPDLVLLDLLMEPLSGIEVLQEIHRIMPVRSRPPVLVMTGDTTTEAKHDALAAGATDFLSKPFDPVETLLRIAHMLEARSLFQQCQTYSQSLEALVSKRTAALQERTRDLEKTLAELRETQQQVIQQERVRALGTMASGLAHDLNNGLSLILGYGEILLSQEREFPVGSKERRFLENMVCAGRDNAQLVKRLRDFYRPNDAQEHRQAVDLNGVVAQAISMTSPKWQAESEALGRTIRIETQAGELPMIEAAPAELREVLTNLIFNAVDAMPKGGTISFRTYQDGTNVFLEVHDTGTGMTEETRRRCLDPFYTTKGEDGSGLGLAVSYGIVRRHGGAMQVRSRVNYGTTFLLQFPIPNQPLELLPFEPIKPSRPLHVLVVDDHAGIREIVSAYLAEDRHTVETAADGKEAMQKFMRTDFDLIITDRAMPRMNGVELAAKVKRMKPSEPVIMLTGFADVMNEDEANVDCVLNKPARLDELRQAILKIAPRN
jgi:signal transduction histidine kinase